MFAPMQATITDYSVGLFIHILAVVLAFGPTFGYAFIFSVVAAVSAGDAGADGGGAEDRSLPGQPGDDRAAARRHLPARRRPLEGSDAFIGVGIVAIIALFGLQHGFFQPQTRKARELAERDLKTGDTLSDEFLVVSQRIGQVGAIAGLIVVVTIFFMVVKP